MLSTNPLSTAKGVRPTSRHRERPAAEMRPQDGEVRALASQILSQIEQSKDAVQVTLADQECALPIQDLIGDDRVNSVSRAHWVADRLLEVQSLAGQVDVNRVLGETTRLGAYPNRPGKNPQPAKPRDAMQEWMEDYRRL